MQISDASTLRGRDPLGGALPIEVVVELSTAPPGDLRRLAGAFRRQANSLNWRRRVAFRNSATSRALRIGERFLGPAYLGRERGKNGEWRLYAWVNGERLLAVEVRPPKLARFADFTAPTVVHVRVPDVLDVGRLEALLMAPTQRTGK